MNLENWDGFKDSCELVAEGAGAGYPFSCGALLILQYLLSFNGPFFQPTYHGFSRELSLLDLLCYLMLQGSFHCKLSAAGNSVKDLGLATQDN